MSATQQSDRTATVTASTTATAPTTATATATTSDVPQRIRAATVEEALRRARELLGDDAEIIEANRIRRGGIGGFFATELGVEVLAQSAAGMVGDRPTVSAEPPAPGVDTEHDVLGRSARSARPQLPAGPATDYGTMPGLGRAAWRAASADAAAASPATPSPAAEAGTPSLLHDLLERAAADQLAASTAAGVAADAPPARPSKIFRAWRVHDGAAAAAARPSMFDDEIDGETVESEPPGTTRETGPATEPATGAGIETGIEAGTDAPTTFAEHFLRELMTDAAALRNDPARPRAPQARRRPRSDAPTLPGIADTSPVESPVDDAVEDAAPPVAPAIDETRSAATDATVVEPATAPPAGGARTKRAPRRRPAARLDPPAPELPLELAPAQPAAPATVAAPSKPGSIQADALGTIVDQCLQLAATADADGPRKVAVAVTMGDGQVVKITVEPARGR